jgi:cyclophilin family peptidyl-prolyl cis-trans isomerase
MKRLAPLALLALTAQAPAPPPAPKPAAPSPNEIVAAAPAADWVAIAASDLLVMDLPPLGTKPRRVVIQLMPPPFSQGWIGNIRKLAAARWWDGTSINRVQDNYVVQWGDATEKKALPVGLATMPESSYELSEGAQDVLAAIAVQGAEDAANAAMDEADGKKRVKSTTSGDVYSDGALNFRGWPIAMRVVAEERESYWPVHCYGMVGVGRNLSPDTGSGAELYTVIGHAPRHLDRNIALVGRVIEGIEHLSSLPRGTGALGFYEKAEERVAIVSVRMGNEIADLPRFEYLSTESESFARYADARANRRDPFFNVPAGGADICNIPVPVRRAK